jgi:hypothetical protein
MRLIAATLLGALAVAASPAAEATPATVWHMARSPHFEVYATGAPSRALDALKMFEDARAFFVSYLSLPESRRPPIRVLVFSGAKEFSRYQVNDSADAFYQPGRDRDYIAMKDFNGDSFRVIAHEYAHAALGLKGADLPPWLSEGLAEFFSSVSLVGNKARLGAAPKGRLAALRPTALMPLLKLLAVRRDSDDYNARGHAGMFYAESWALTHMLFVDGKYRDNAPHVIALAENGQFSPEAMAAAFGRSLSTINKDLRAYITRGEYAFYTVDMPQPPPAVPVPATAVTPFDASVVLAGLLVSQPGKESETRALLDLLEREQPNNLTVVETRAFLELLTHGSDAADAPLLRAVDLGSQNAGVLAACALRLASRDPERASALLSRASALAPDDMEIRVQAAAMMIRRERPADARTLFDTIARVPPDLEFEYYQIAANLHAMAGDLDLAAAAVARVAAAAHTPEEVAFAASLMKTVGGPADMSKVVEGRIMALTCTGAMPILQVNVDGDVMTLAIDDPKRILIPGGGTLDLSCGEQDTQARVGYSEAEPPTGTAGRVRFLDFRKKRARR